MQIDWSEYSRVHANRRNLVIHLLAVPLFFISFIGLVITLFRGEIVAAGSAAMVCVLSLALQGIGHRSELEQPRPFTGPGDFLRRWFGEQYLVFPMFVVRGKWSAQYRAARVRNDDES